MLTHALAALAAASLCSFGGAVVYRYREGFSLLSPRSFCDHCRAPLPRKALFPVIGPLLARMRCPHCGRRTPLLYPVTELLGVLTMLLPLAAGYPLPTVLYCWVFGWALLVVATTDIVSGLVPLPVIVAAATLGLALRLAGAPGPSLQDALLGTGGGWGFFFLVRVLSRGGSGLGDADFAALLGAFLGWRDLTGVLITAFLAGGVWAGALLLGGTARRGSRVPFTPFLAAAAGLVMLTGNWIFRLYGWPV